MTLYEAFFIVGGICIAIILFFIYVCKKLSINYKSFLLHSFSGFLGCYGILILTQNITNIHTLGTATSALLALCFGIIGFLINQEIIGFIFLSIGFAFLYNASNAICLLYTLSIKANIFFLIDPVFKIINNPIFKITFMFFIMLSTFLSWSILHKKYKFLQFQK